MNIDTSNWQVQKTVDGVEIKWFPILTLTFETGPKRTIGITENGEWISKWFNGNIVILNSREKCFDILVCLEKSRSEFERLLKESISNFNLAHNLLKAFPIVELIKFSLKSNTHWSVNASSWLREEDMDKELEELTIKFINDKHYPQNARHHAFRILKNWQGKQ